PTSPPHPHLHPFPTRRSSDLEMAAPPGAIEARKIPEEMGTGSASPSKGKGSAARGALPRAIVDSGSRREEWVSFQGTTQFPTSQDRKSTRLNSSHVSISYAVF